jgi:hypothetical protein
MSATKEHAMRFMILVKASADSDAGALPGQGLIAEMGAYHEELARAGVLLDGSGLRPSREGWRVRCDGGQRRVIDGPFGQSSGMVAGYALIQVRSRAEALEWALRFPNPSVDGGAAEIEVRPLHELDDFGAPGESAARDRMRALEAAPRAR